MGVIHSGHDAPKFTWKNAAVVLEVHGGRDQGWNRPGDETGTRKRKQAPPLSESSKSKKTRTSFSSHPLLRTPSFARLSTRSQKRRLESLEVEQKDESEGEQEPNDLSENPDKDKDEDEDEAYNPNNYYYNSSTPLIDARLRMWATEVFSSCGNRRHVIGIHASCFDIRFYFFDRTGVIYTEALQIGQTADAVSFVAAIIGMSLVSPFQLGLDPFFAPSPRLPWCKPSPDVLSPTNFMWTDLVHVEGAVVRVDGMDFVIEDLIMSSESIHGRGTTVFGVRPAVRADFVHSPSIQADSPSRRSVRETKPRLPHSSLANMASIDNGRLVLKLAWQIPSRQSEDVLLRLAEEKGVEGVIKLCKSSTLEPLSRGYRGKLVPRKMYVDRELRVQVLGPRCIPLKRVGDTKDFKEAFRALVRG